VSHYALRSTTDATQLAAFILTFFFSAMVVSFLSALFSSLRVVASRPHLEFRRWPDNEFLSGPCLESLIKTFVCHLGQVFMRRDLPCRTTC
jgi:hypothetical protein